MADKVTTRSQMLAQAGVPLAMRSGQAAKVLGISKKTLRRLTHDGQIEATLINREARYHRSDLARYIEMGRLGRQSPESK